MKISPVDEGNDLYAISEVFEKSLMDQLLKQDLLSYEWQRENMQADLARRALKFTDGILYELDLSINNKQNLQQLSDTLGRECHRVASNFWLDMPGYEISNHPDNPVVKDVIQVYLWPNLQELGTTFYQNTASDKELDESGSWRYPTSKNYPPNLTLRKQFDYVVNTGYIMKNNYQIHGMTVPVPPKSLRFSLYGHIG